MENFARAASWKWTPPHSFITTSLPTNQVKLQLHNVFNKPFEVEERALAALVLAF